MFISVRDLTVGVRLWFRVVQAADLLYFNTQGEQSFTRMEDQPKQAVKQQLCVTAEVRGEWTDWMLKTCSDWR